jgi:AcrR family transcriptional regulator
MKTRNPALVRGNATREALITAAIAVFARDGFHAASTRAITAAAKVNQALIGYHFHGKEGLYRAVFERLTRHIADRMIPVMEEVRDSLAFAEELTDAAARHERILSGMLLLLETLLEFVSRDDSTAFAQLVMREQQSPTAAFSLIYDGFMGKHLELLTQLASRLDPRHDALHTRLKVLTIMGQVLMFRIARASVRRHMAWSTIGSEELELVKSQLRRNLGQLFPSSSRTAVG